GFFRVPSPRRSGERNTIYEREFRRRARGTPDAFTSQRRHIWGASTLPSRRHEMRKIGLLVGVSFGLATLALTPDLAAAEHVTVVPRPGVVAQPGVVYVQPAPAPNTVTV